MSENSNSIHFLVELRTKLIYSLILLFSLFTILVYFANELYTLLAFPLLKFLPQGHLIATQIVSPFFIPFKLAFWLAILLAMPFFLYQLWTFIAPALYRYERRFVWPLLLLSTSLFYAGIAFAYLVIFPILFRFLSNTVPQGVVLSPDIAEYLDFTVHLLLVFGIIFEIPIVMTILVSMNIVSRTRFILMRPYAIVCAFVIGMLFAPPDVLSQIILAIPICLLYEAGIMLSNLVNKKS
ncbi:MAG: twin arginine-targeting protein translocase TatC [Gammaproteobacteria bacterium RIFCSPHIGHO2_12_FULL_37_14]|nr:MAG: twin arginine-targeting protein translocase TatC [Gammaproteobacteria bacterium RIFCSPHIGHO2_12_FULL_37_14]